MGCVQGKVSKPTAASAPATDSEPTSTLLNTTHEQKHVPKEGGETATSVIDSSESQAAEEWPLRWKAMRVFAMAPKATSGVLDAGEFAGDGSDMRFKEMLQRVLEGDVARLLSQAEWLERVKSLALQDERQAAEFLDLCVAHLGERLEDWPLRDEALQVFRMGDRNGSGQLEMSELAEIRRSDKFAQALMDKIDIDRDGTVSKGEWLAYVKRMADKDEKSAAAVLALYRRRLSSSSNTTEACDAPKAAVDVLVEDRGVKPARKGWVCC